MQQGQVPRSEDCVGLAGPSAARDAGLRASGRCIRVAALAAGGALAKRLLGAYTPWASACAARPCGRS